MDIAIYGSHDASISFKCSDQYYVLEVERFIKERYAALTDYYNYLSIPFPNNQEYITILDLVKSLIDEPIDVCYYNQLFDSDFEKIRNYLRIKKFQIYGHHYAHACGAFYQSNFNESYIISYDGGGGNEDGTDSYFTVWLANSDGVKKIKDINLNLGVPYQLSAIPISDIKKTQNGLSSSGKLMGYYSYGKVNYDWLDAFYEFYKTCNLDVFKKINLDITENCMSGEQAMDFAATSQYVFEQLFFDVFNELNITKGSNLCITGGCALNIVVNQKLIELGYKLYVPPNPNDSGLSIGALLSKIKAKNVDIVYSGFDILDAEYLSDKPSVEINNKDLAKLLYKDKKIIGYVEGRSECGPRALGNRSILCYPDVDNLKDKINAEIKFREWFRPFGAVIKIEDLGKYFINGMESRYMSYCPTLKPEYRFKSITHVDNTCRVQTVAKNQHPNLYNILTEIEKIGGYGILLNTSFNIKGKPILTRLEDAYTCLKNTKLNGFVYKDRLYAL
jgi:carbamoyltransferase